MNTFDDIIEHEQEEINEHQFDLFFNNEETHRMT